VPTRPCSAAVVRALSSQALSRVVAVPVAPSFPTLEHSSVVLAGFVSVIPPVGALLSIEPAFRGATPRFVRVWVSCQTQACAVEVEDCSCPGLAGERTFQVWAGV